MNREEFYTPEETKRIIDQTEELVIKVADGAKPSHVGTAFCSRCFKSTVHLLNNEFTQTMCRECGIRRPARKVGQNGKS